MYWRFVLHTTPAVLNSAIYKRVIVLFQMQAASRKCQTRIPILFQFHLHKGILVSSNLVFSM